ncbi:MAG: glutamine--fructose-6-phosphate transaminase (isomerizing) [Oscillospiraceae bacterium]|jgi:glucosamine--fructose-6-phosphate aminotransferase (isomerizing)|nr:glutamine--fructose-6-phosphate transaminase (isomerizing) [Oscillospiraceae bacterium]
MCGIVGYAGSEQAVPILMGGLAKLEYRGYDSAGVALQQDCGLTVIKSKGRLAELRRQLETAGDTRGTVGLGHTRWATHGEPSDLNAHPHLSQDARFAVVHNGIIENYIELKQMLLEKGYTFQSQTDTEVIVNLLAYYDTGDLLDTVLKVRNKLGGSYALGVLSAAAPGQIVAVRKDSPLIVGLCKSGALMASDIPALIAHTRDYYELSEREAAVLTKDGARFYNVNREPVSKTPYHVDWDIDAASLGGYEHFMMKEIMEQPRVLRDTISSKIHDGEVVFPDVSLTRAQVEAIDRLYIVACGSAAHAGMVGKHVIRRVAGLSAEVELASEFRYQEPLLTDRSLVVIISQSGETADSLAALRYAREKGAKTLAVVNVLGSSIARSAEHVIYTNAGPEIAVATTKAYSCQLAVMYLLAVYLGRALGRLSDEDNASLLKELQALPDKADALLGCKETMQYYAAQYYGAKDIFLIGRNLDYAAALEASLKLKEISYIHSEAYAAGELKHGPIALLERGTLVVALAATVSMADKLRSNILEVKARGAEVLALAQEGDEKIKTVADALFEVPRTPDIFTPSMTIIPMQFFAYYVAAMRGMDIDKPRNLAKSVTVE